MKNYKLFIFDLDGVIFDTKSNMRQSWNSVKKKHNLKIPFENYFLLIGTPFKKILKKLGIYKNINEISTTYSEASKKNINLVKIYPGVKKVLLELRKSSKVAVVTSKEKKRARFFLKKFDLKFDSVSCPERGKRGKPYPDQILKVIRRFNLKKRDCVYVGDMKVDFTAANNAKIDFILANYGYEKKIMSKVIKINKFIDLIK